MTNPASLTQIIVDRAIAVAADIARTLHLAEQFCAGGYELNAQLPTLDLRTACPSDFLSTLAKLRFLDSSKEIPIANSAPDPTGICKSLRSSIADFDDADLAEAEERLATLILDGWRTEVQPEKQNARRPDVLRLAIRFLSNPKYPETQPVVRFMVVLALRASYRIPHTVAGLRKLRAAHKDLQLRFESQQRRRQLSESGTRRKEKWIVPYENFLLDLLAMEGLVVRRLRQPHLKNWYGSFQALPFGINNVGGRDFGDIFPELTGQIPDFGTMYNLAFNQPTGIAGFDFATAGIAVSASSPDIAFNRTVDTSGSSDTAPQWDVSDAAPEAPPNGVVSLFVGAPGTGKSTLVLTIAERLAELGATVQYLATEEPPVSVETRRAVLISSLQELLLPGESRKGAIVERDNAHSRVARPGVPTYMLGRLGFTYMSDREDGRDITLETVAAQIEADLSKIPSSDLPEDGEMYLSLPTVLVIDSLTALRESAAAVPSRRQLTQLLNRMRKLGVSVFLVGSLSDLEDDGLEYLVDNVFVLGLDGQSSPRHPVRTFEVRKTRLHASHRGVHVLHISRNKGAEICPSLHAVLRDLKMRHAWDADPDYRALLWVPPPSGGEEQLSFPGFETGGTLALRAHAQTLVYGSGSSGKAGLALALAFEPRFSCLDEKSWKAYAKQHEAGGADNSFDTSWAHSARVLVVSFLYPDTYYSDLAERLFKKRFRLSREIARERTTTISLYPGYIDPETVVARVTSQIRRSRLEGRPYTAVILDGLHNLLLQFPLLEADKLIWPTLFSLFRVEGLDTITTFSLIGPTHSVGGVSPDGAKGPDDFIPETESAFDSNMGNARLFFQLLASKCDYTISMKRGWRTRSPQRERAVLVTLEDGVDGLPPGRSSFYWDSEKLSYRRSH